MTDTDRIVINQILSGSYTAEGIKRWWERPRMRLLDGQSPQEMWDAGEHKKVLELAQELIR